MFLSETHKCNPALGPLNDDPDALMGAVAYLLTSRSSLRSVT